MSWLVDTNILLRLVEPAHSMHPVAAGAFESLLSLDEAICALPQNIAEFWNVLTRPATARGGYGLSVTEAERRLLFIERHFSLLPDSAAAYFEWKRLVVAHQVMGIQVHDARLAALMTTHGISHVLTLNPADFARYTGIIVVTPHEIVHPTPSGR